MNEKDLILFFDTLIKSLQGAIDGASHKIEEFDAIKDKEGIRLSSKLNKMNDMKQSIWLLSYFIYLIDAESSALEIDIPANKAQTEEFLRYSLYQVNLLSNKLAVVKKYKSLMNCLQSSQEYNVQ